MNNKIKKINLSESENTNFVAKGSLMKNEKLLKRFKIERSKNKNATNNR